MRPPPCLPPPASPSPYSLYSPLETIASTSSTSSDLTLPLTIRYLPTDEWTTLSVSIEWRAFDLKRFAFDLFERNNEGHQLEERRSNDNKGRERTSQEREERKRMEKENERSSELGETRKERMLEVGTDTGMGEKEKKTPGGVKRFATALRDRLSSKDLNSLTLPPRSIPSALGPHDSSTSPLPSRHSLSASSTPTATEFNLETPTRPRVQSRQSEDSHSHSQSRRSSLANFESLQLAAAAKRNSEEGAEEKEVLISLEEASPLTARRMERSKSLSEKNRDTSSSTVMARTRRNHETELKEQKNLMGWVLVNAVTGGTIPDHAIIGSKFVENDILTLKPSHVLYDPPLHLYHLPYLSFPSVSVLPASLSTCRTSFDFSNGSGKGHSRRRSFGGRYAKEELVERRIVIEVDDGVFAGAQGDRELTPGTTMVLKVIKVNQLEAIYSLPPQSLQLVSSSSSSSSTSHSHSTPPPMPSSSSTASLANLILPSGPSTSNLRQSIGPSPSSTSIHTKQRGKPSTTMTRSLPMIQLSWEDGESLALRAKSKVDHERLMRILGEPQEGDEERDQEENQRRKDLIDLAFATRHHLLDPFSLPQSRPSSRRAQLPPIARSRPRLQPRSVSDNSTFSLPPSPVPPPPSLPRSRRDLSTPDRSSSVLHIRKRDISPPSASESSEIEIEQSHRTPSSTSISTFSSSPSTPTSFASVLDRERYLPEVAMRTTITPATPSHLSDYSPPSKAEGGGMTGSSSYFSLYSYSNPLAPPAYTPPTPTTKGKGMGMGTGLGGRTKSSLDLSWASSSTTRNTSALKSLDEVEMRDGSRRKTERRRTDRLGGGA
ncbi:uncharacterized protein JCM6883_002161 [Sporobolomyces salmoneus]|uniref:uncharacterized protein n=1 Tax=Sporobolomyces salmoneus TaxID=183962 RepID=UPI0031803C1D